MTDTAPTAEADIVKPETAEADAAELEQLAVDGHEEELQAYVDELAPGELARAMYRMPADERTEVLTHLSADEAAEVLEGMSEDQAADMLGGLETADAAAIVAQLHSDEQVDLLHRLGEDQTAAILEAMPASEADDCRDRLDYADDVAGGLMITEYLAFEDTLTVGQVIDRMRQRAEEYAEYDVQYAYITAPSGRLVGVLRLRDLLLTRGGVPVREVMIPEPRRVRTDDTLETLDRFFEEHHWFGVPAVTEEGVLAGIVRASDVERAVGEEADKALLKFAGIASGEELRSLPLLLRCKRRLVWLSLNIMLNVLAVTVIALNQDVLAAVIALTIYMPIISDMSGCSGNQAVAVSMREISLGLIRPGDLLGVLWNEARLGLINGAVLGTLVALVACLWQQSMWLGMVVGVALAVNTLLAVCLGGALPLLMRALDKDPALASGPLLTTITDMCGFFLVLTLASAVRPYLVGL